jgi:hypothetical protein
MSSKTTSALLRASLLLKPRVAYPLILGLIFISESELRKQLRIDLAKKNKQKSPTKPKKTPRFEDLHKTEKKNDLIQVLLNAQTHSKMSEQKIQKTKGKVRTPSPCFIGSNRGWLCVFSAWFLKEDVRE